MKSCLLFTRTSKIAGAEKMAQEIFLGLDKSQFKIKMAYLNEISVFKAIFGKYDIIHSHLFLPGLAIRLRRVFDTNFVWIHTVHYDSYQQQAWSKVKKYLDENFIFTEADRLIAVSSSVADQLNLNKKLLSPVVLINNCVRFLDNKINIQKKQPKNKIILGTVAMLRTEKGLIDLISIVEELVQKNSNFYLKIAGDGPQRKILEQIIHQKKLQNHIEICGYLNDLSAFYESIDIFVTATYIESFGLAIIEAMQFGLPIVASSVGQIPVILKNGQYGTLVSRDNDNFIKRFAKSIEDTLINYDKYSEASVHAFKYYQENLQPKKFIQDHQNLYADLLKPGVYMVSPVITHATGGIQKQMKLQSKELNRLGYRVFMLQKQDPDFYFKKNDWTHVTFLQTPIFAENLSNKFKILSRLGGLMFILFGVPKIWKHRHKISVIHAHQLFSSTTLGFLGKIFFKKILVVKVTASGEYGELNELNKLPFRKLRNISFKSIDKVIVLSDEMKSEMQTLGFDDSRIALIPNSVEMVSNSSTVIQTDKKVFRILFTGRLSTEKSLDTLIEAARILANEGISCHVTLVGGASYGGRDCHNELQEIANKTTDGLKITFAGVVKNISAYYQDADVFVLPSVSEGMSNALLEAMSYGLACVVSSIPANLFVVKSGFDALVFETKNSAELANQLRLLRPGNAESDALRSKLGANAKATVQQRFSIEMIGQKISNLYHEVDKKNGYMELQHD